VALALAAAIGGCGVSDASGPPDGAPPAGADPGAGAVTPPGDAPPAHPGAPPPGPAACARADLARTAPASLFDAFEADLAAVPAGPSGDAARAGRVDQLLADVSAQGGTPLEDPKTGRAVFLVRGAPPAGSWSVVGSFVGWDKGQRLAMSAVEGTDLYAVDTVIPAGQSQTYKLLTGDADEGFVEDLLATNVVWDGIDHHTVGEMNAIVHPADQPKDHGRLERAARVHAQKLGDDRDVFVYLPPRYDDGSCAKLPMIVFHDGNESLTRGDFAGVADELYASRPELSAILVFVALPTQDVRMDQYTFGTPGAKGDDYVDFLAADLMPKVTGAYRVCAKADARGISGASLGGLISTYAAFAKPGVFGWVGAQSASYFWADDALVDRASTSPVIPTRFYLDSGEPGGACGEEDNCAITDEMAATLTSKGYEVERVKVPNAEHDWPYWRARLPGMLTSFRDGHTACD
jgi:enterochelin esterase family protein